MNTSILTIDPGSRFFGLAVFHGERIMSWKIKNLSTKDSSPDRLRKVREMFHALFLKYRPEIIVIEKPADIWKAQSPYLGRIIGSIKRIARKKHIRIVEFTPEVIRKALCRDERATKGQLAEAISAFYPELSGYLQSGLKYKEAYWGHVVNSISLGICYLKCRKRY